MGSLEPDEYSLAMVLVPILPFHLFCLKLASETGLRAFHTTVTVPVSSTACPR
jgi:hypothetical protein